LPSSDRGAVVSIVEGARLCRIRASPNDYLASTIVATPSTQEEAMKYLCLIYSDETQWSKAPQAEIQKMMSEYRGFTESIKASGHFVTGFRLHPTPDATTLRSRNGKLDTTDGPFAETKEQLGGFYLIEARDLNDAIQVASRIPGVRVGSIEVRPVDEVPAPVA
jgi:hypothetical protein